MSQNVSSLTNPSKNPTRVRCHVWGESDSRAGVRARWQLSDDDILTRHGLVNEAHSVKQIDRMPLVHLTYVVQHMTSMVSWLGVHNDLSQDLERRCVDRLYKIQDQHDNLWPRREIETYNFIRWVSSTALLGLSMVHFSDGKGKQQRLASRWPQVVTGLDREIHA